MEWEEFHAFWSVIHTPTTLMFSLTPRHTLGHWLELGQPGDESLDSALTVIIPPPQVKQNPVRNLKPNSPAAAILSKEPKYVIVLHWLVN